MSENLKVESALAHKNQQLMQELNSALNIIKYYESQIIELKNTQTAHLKKITHDIASPLQILSMTIESLMDSPTGDPGLALERMKRATDTMTEVIRAARKLTLEDSQKDKLQKAV